MSKDGLLPDDVTESMIPGNRPGDNHSDECPMHEDADKTYSECGGINECRCPGFLLAVSECRIVEPDCQCGEDFLKLLMFP